MLNRNGNNLLMGSKFLWFPSVMLRKFLLFSYWDLLPWNISLSIETCKYKFLELKWHKTKDLHKSSCQKTPRLNPAQADPTARVSNPRSSSWDNFTVQLSSRAQRISWSWLKLKSLLSLAPALSLLPSLPCWPSLKPSISHRYNTVHLSLGFQEVQAKIKPKDIKEECACKK